VKKTAQKKARAGVLFFFSPSLHNVDSRSVRCIPTRPLHLSRPLSLSAARRRRRPKPGAEALVGLFAGEEHPPGTPSPSVPFPSSWAPKP
jgi:hypothetical protein